VAGVYDHYLPINVDDPLPRGIAGAVVSLADRIDTLTGFFRIGAQANRVEGSVLRCGAPRRASSRSCSTATSGR